MPGGQINDPSLGKHFSLQFLPATPSFPSWILEGPFKLIGRPSSALDSPRALLPEILGHRKVSRTRFTAPRTPSKRADANLDCAFAENALSYKYPNLLINPISHHVILGRLVLRNDAETLAKPASHPAYIKLYNFNLTNRSGH